MLKKNRKNKFKLITSFLGITATGGIAAIAASCSQPNASTVNSLFKTSDDFSNLKSLTNTDLAATALSQKEGFNSFLNATIANVLKVWYENNPDQNIKDKIKNWNDEINKSWDTQAQSYRDQYRQDYQVKLQTDLLDPVGGTEASWKQNEFNTRILSDFISLLYSGDYLRYVDANGVIVTQPSSRTLRDSKNWVNLKYTNQTSNKPLYTDAASIDNNRQMFAEMQGFIFNKWVTEQNPNLISRVVFTNETPKNGFASIFNSQLISNPTASYEFQFFNNADPSSTILSAASAYQSMIHNGLSKYVSDYQIDIPIAYSGDSGGKLLMTADDMFNSYDLPFTAAFVDQYLKMLGNINISWPSGTPANSIMENFIRNDTNGTQLDYATQKSFENQTLPFFNNSLSDSNSPYNFYYGLDSNTTTSPTKSLYDVFSPTSTSSNPNENQFIFARGKDGVHVIAIDGGGYYLNSTSKTRDIKKQEQFLMFRSLYRILNYVPKDYDYSFNATTQSQNWFQNNEAMLIFEAFASALKTADNQNYFDTPSNANLKAAFQSLYDKVNDYVTSADQYLSYTNYIADVNTIRSKISEHVKTYEDNDKNKTSVQNGLAGRFPNPAATDGSYPSLEAYYALLMGDVPTDSSSFLNVTKAGSRSYFNQKLNSAKATFIKAADDLAKSLTLTPLSVSPYSQDIILKSNSDDSYSLPINLAINSTISSNDISNKIKLAYFRNSQLFGDFYDETTKQLKNTYPNFNDIQAPLQNYYNILQWIDLSDKRAYGVPDATGQPSFDTILKNVFQDQNISKDANNDNTLNYYTYLYTFAWLIQDNFARFKSILSSQISQGINGIVSWYVPMGSGTILNDNNNPLKKFDANPNFLWGTPTNWSNQTNTPSAGNLSNNLDNPYLYTKTSDSGINHYGFNGLTLAGDSKINADLAPAFFSEFNNSKFNNSTVSVEKYSRGALYQYGSSAADVNNYVQGMQSLREINSFIDYLRNAGFDVSSAAFATNNNDFEIKKAAVKKLINDLNTSDNYVFNQYKGFIGENKTDDINSLRPKFSADGRQKFPAYVVQVNFEDVNKIGATSWTDSNGRMGLDLYSFLTIVAMQAADSGTQNNAVSYLLNTSNITGTTGQKIKVGDNRLYNALTNRWVDSLS